MVLAKSSSITNGEMTAGFNNQQLPIRKLAKKSATGAADNSSS